MSSRFRTFSAFLFPALTLLLVAARAAPVRVGHVQAELLAEPAAIAPATPFTVALRLQTDEHWHTYWRNPGDSGQATSITWELPPGFSAGPIQWPVPVRIPTPPFMTYGFEDEAVLLTEITPPADLSPGQTVALVARADWLVCSDVCIPGKATLRVSLPVAAEAGVTAPDPATAGLFQTARARLPVADAHWPATFHAAGDELTFDVALPAGTRVDASQVYFFAHSDVVVDAAKPQVASLAQGHLRLRVKKSAYATEIPASITGVLTAPGGFPPAHPGRAVTIEAQAGPAVAIDASAGTGAGWVGMLVSGFLGGLILNLMPCVFPVLGVKILGFVNQSGADRRKVTAHGLVFTAGVLLSFWVLAGALIALRAGGEQLGWGFQLQSPAFVFGLTALLLVFGLNLSGVFEFGLRATGVGASLQMRSGYAGSFFTGVLATVVSTPCAAPFLAGALGAALTLPAPQSMVLFTCIALGLATPYLVLSAFPKLVRALPRPGAWMETFKQLMAFALYATVAYLVYVLAGQVGDALFATLGGLVLIAAAAWAYGRWTQTGGSAARRRFGYAFAGVLLAAGLAAGYPRQPDSEIVWREWSPETIASLRAEGKIVYVDFTARWCATCKVNKFVVFSSPAVRERFATLGVVPVRADWTNQDEAITRALASFGRSAVPFNVIYAPGRDEPVILPEVLTPGIVLEALDQVAPATAAADAPLPAPR